MEPELLSPGKKAQHTSRWARTMVKWLITHSRPCGAKWRLVDFCGDHRSESCGVVDMIAVRKNHHHAKGMLKRGDLFEIVLIQIKGGSAREPTREDIARLKAVARHHRAKAIVLAKWKRGKTLNLCRLRGLRWEPASPGEIFGSFGPEWTRASGSRGGRS